MIYGEVSRESLRYGVDCLLCGRGRACSAWASLRELTFQQHPSTARELIEKTIELMVIIWQEDGTQQATETRGLDCTCGETSS